MDNKKIYLVAADMGYGHQRAAYPLLSLSRNGIINLNDYPEIDNWEKSYWLNSQKSYEKISYFKRVPVLGELVFRTMDYFQKIDAFYPRRYLSKSTLQQKLFFQAVKKGVGKKLIESLNKEVLPLVTTFFVAAYCAEYYNYQGLIYCVVCDADISRAWAPLHPRQSRIKYFAPTQRVAERLKFYGVKEENIFLTGYPLPMEIVGKKLEKVKEDLKQRIINLDPCLTYQKKYGAIIKEKIGELPAKADRPLTIMFAVGGAGAQKEIGAQLLKQLRDNISNREVKIILVAGIKEKIKEYFENEIDKLKINLSSGMVEVIFEKTFEKYFDSFNSALRRTDILWTKPSELSFYSALGLPIIIAPTIGSQEDFNRAWLLNSGFGIDEEKVEFVKDWFFDWLRDGRLAEMAMQGFVEGEQLGALKIKNIIEK